MLAVALSAGALCLGVKMHIEYIEQSPAVLVLCLLHFVKIVIYKPFVLGVVVFYLFPVRRIGEIRKRPVAEKRRTEYLGIRVNILYCLRHSYRLFNDLSAGGFFGMNE